MRKEDGKKFFYQWELGQRLIVDEDCTLIQFSNGTFTNALGCEVKEENGVRYAEVPNILLQTAADLHAYAWDEKTTSVIGHNVFSVVPMPKPDNYVYTETDVLTWKSFDMRIKRYEGEGNVVGLRGYYWSQIMFNQDGLGGAVALTDSSDIPAVIPQEVAKISDVLADFENPYSAGDVFSMVNGGQYALCGTITGVDNNVIYFSCTKAYLGFPEYSVGEGTTRVKQMDPVSRAFDDYTFGVIEKADKGIVEIVKGSVAIGINNRSTGNSSFVEGKDNVAYGDYAHAEGRLNRAAYAAHAEGRENDASGWYSHAEGYRSKATEQQAHVEGRMTLASGQAAHAEGNTSQATGNSSHAEGEETIAGAIQAHAEGCKTQATAQAAHSEGFNTKARGFASHSEGRGSVADGYVSHAEGEETQATGSTSHAEGRLTTASNQAAHAEGEGTTASGRYSHAEGYKTQASGQESHAEGYQTKATDFQAHAEGHTTTASGHTSHAEGYGTVASGEYSHAEGYQTKATSYAAHAEGVKTVAEGQFTHAEGYETQATNQYAHAEGYLTKATAYQAHAEGRKTTAEGQASHAEGSETVASGQYAHAEGCGTIASGLSTHAEGRFNVGDTEGKFLHIIGNGTSNTNRSNAFAVDKDGNGYYGGDLFAKCGKDSTRGTKVDVDKLAKLDVNSVSFGAEQNLSDDQKAQARGNIGAASVEDLEAVAIVCEASGEVISVSDASNLQMQGLTLYGKTTQTTTTGKNLIDMASHPKCKSGVIETLYSEYYELDDPFALVPVALGETYTFSYAFIGGDRIIIRLLNSAGEYLSNVKIGWGTYLEAYGGNYGPVRTGATFTIPADSTVTHVQIWLTKSTECGRGNINTYTNIQLELGSVATAYEPYTGRIASPNPDYPQDLVSVGNDGNIDVTVAGRNLFDASRMTSASATTVVNSDGSVTVTNNIGYPISLSVMLTGKLPSGTYTLHNISGSTLYLQTSASDYATQIGVGAKKTFSYDGVSYLKILFTDLAANKTITYKVMLNYGAEALPHEPYNAQTLTAQTPNGLPGIPVSSGGNYTDANGQQWVCDEVDFTRGVYVQRINKIVFDGSSDEQWYSLEDYKAFYVRQIEKGFNKLWSEAMCDKLPNMMGDEALQDFTTVGFCLWDVNDKQILIRVLNDINDTVALRSWLSDNPLTIFYQLATPISIPIPAEEISPIAALHTNKPNTTVFNDSGAGMKVEYVADSKAYIDNKFAQLAAQIVNNT